MSFPILKGSTCSVLYFCLLKHDLKKKKTAAKQINEPPPLQGESVFHVRKLKIITYLWTERTHVPPDAACFTLLCLVRGKKEIKAKGFVIIFYIQCTN